MRSEIRNGVLVYDQPLGVIPADDGKRRIRAEDTGYYSFECPGCKSTHMYGTNKDHKPCWDFNGSLSAPTFYPSMIVRRGAGVCHFFVNNGQIEFLGDSTHELSGEAVMLPEITEGN